MTKETMKTLGVAIAAAFFGGVAAVGIVGQPASAATSNVGVVNYSEVIDSLATAQGATAQMQSYIIEEKNAFSEKAAGLSEEERVVVLHQAEENIKKKRLELLAPIKAKVDANVQSVAEKQGISVVLDSGAVVYGGHDITDAVIKEVK